MARKIKVLFFTSSLGGGGAEMHLVRLLKHIDRETFEPSLALARPHGSYEWMLPADVPVFHLTTGRVPSSTLQMVVSLGPLRRLVKQLQPDIVFSTLDHANCVAVVATQGMPVRRRIVLGVQTPPTRYQNPVPLSNRFVLSAMQFLYPKADAIVALSKGAAGDLISLVPTIHDRTSVIHNIGFDDGVILAAREAVKWDRRPLIVAVGRLVREKGYPYLIRAFKRVRSRVAAQLVIIGDGAQRDLLQQMIHHEQLADSVTLMGFQKNPFKYMATADIFVLSSIWEGFGNVIVEAMACGAPVVATDCPYGPGEIITHGVNGLLVPPADEATLAEAILRLLGDSALRERLSQNGRVRAQDFSAEKITTEYENLFLQLMQGRSIS